jgi:nucleoside-diphosphate-sugar epimerase
VPGASLAPRPGGLFAFGFGYSARAVVRRMQSHLAHAWGTTRDPAKLADIAGCGVEPMIFTEAGLGESAGALSDALNDADQVLISTAPTASGDPVLNAVGRELATARPRSVVYLSTVGVYGDHGGAWVDETSVCHPTSDRSLHRLAAEAAWMRFGGEAGIPVAIIRLAGIYGPGRGPFEKLRRGTARRIVKPGQVFNRIHVDDIAGVVEAAFRQAAAGIFNGSDDEPALPQDVLAYAARLIGVPPPPEVPYAEAELTPMARSFYGENKRVRNHRIKADLGVSLAYPTYREGLQAVLAADSRGAAN